MRKPRKPATQVSSLALEILSVLRAEFIQSGRSKGELLNGYAGMKMADLESRFLNGGMTSRVDYDLALRELEEGKLAATGPMEVYDNIPGSSIVIIAMFSKREFIFLKEAGYRMAEEKPKEPRGSVSRQSVNISGGHFYQSPIGVGEQVSQELHFDVTNQSDTANYLVELLAKEGQPADPETKGLIVDMVAKANAGDMAGAKPIFQRVFTALSGPAKQIATSVLTTIATKSLGF